MVLDEGDERGRRHVKARLPATYPLPRVPLALVEVAVLHRRNELLCRASVVRVIRLVAAGESDHGRVVEVVVPQGVQAVPALLDRVHDARVLWLVLVHDDGRSSLRRGAHTRRPISARMCFAGSDASSKMFCVASRRRPSRWNSSIQYAAFAAKKSRTGPESGPSKLIGSPHGVVYLLREVCRAERLEVVSVRAQVVVDDVEDHAETELVGPVDEPAEVVRCRRTAASARTG